MIGIVLTGHGSFPKGILQSVELITGEVKQAEVIPFEEDQEKLEKEIEQAIEKVDAGSGVVCFADLAGGTPFNVCSRIAAAKEDVRVVGGTNSPMLLSGLFQRALAIDEFVEIILKEGKSNIKEFEMKQKKIASDEGGI
ncbi:PTS system, N-acetylgalactosamine-specific IIA component [Lentibacillus halodurans]|uniref:PTS system, N-acetylgalactosamine-specific IIA component n=1 Tax=Lentibacillus halodurans TaxID=237679 RepID=A0A1I0YHE5_9BACI|nr:PTS sugar transporter subunit IIA [Lentibacillus halodurans]SFB12631.1 PTS system, N-acetylgalactosamine-specific IIA component [Lentibacillus halodurans]